LETDEKKKQRGKPRKKAKGMVLQKLRKTVRTVRRRCGGIQKKRKKPRGQYQTMLGERKPPREGHLGWWGVARGLGPNLPRTNRKVKKHRTPGEIQQSRQKTVSNNRCKKNGKKKKNKGLKRGGNHGRLNQKKKTWGTKTRLVR